MNTVHFSFSKLQFAVDFATCALERLIDRRDQPVVMKQIAIELPENSGAVVYLEWPGGGDLEFGEIEYGGKILREKDWENCQNQTMRRIALSDLYRQPMRARHSEETLETRVLLFCGAKTVDEVREFLDDISRDSDCSIRIHTMRWENDGGECEGITGWPVDENITVYEISRNSGKPLNAPAGIRHRRCMLGYRAGINSWMPTEWSHSLDMPGYRTLFPAISETQYRIWLPGEDGQPVYAGVLCEIEDARPLSAQIELRGIKTRVINQRIFVHAPDVPQLPLILKTQVRQNTLAGCDRVIYRVRTKREHVGRALLRMLNGCEAGLEDLLYTARADGDTVYAEVDHYFIGEARLFDGDFWPELERFDCPFALAYRNLPVFIRSDLGFSPDIELLMNDAGQNDSFIEEFAACLNIKSEESIPILVELYGASETDWRVTHLYDAKPLRECINLILPDSARLSIERAAGVVQRDLEQSRKETEQRWLRLAQQETDEVLAAAASWAENLTQQVAHADASMQATDELLEQAQNAVSQTRTLAFRVPLHLKDFLEEMQRHLELLANPRQEWLNATLALERRLEAEQQAAEILLTNVTERADQVVARIQDRQGQLDAQLSLLRLRVADARSRLETLEHDSNEAVNEANRVEHELREWEKRVDLASEQIKTKRGELEGRRNQLTPKQKQLDDDRIDVEQKEQELNDWAERQKKERMELDERRQAADKKSKELEIIRDVTLPQERKDTKKAQDALDVLLTNKYEQKLDKARQQKVEKNRQLEEARKTEQQYTQEYKELVALEKELETLRASNRQLETANAAKNRPELEASIKKEHQLQKRMPERQQGHTKSTKNPFKRMMNWFHISRKKK